VNVQCLRIFCYAVPRNNLFTLLTWKHHALFRTAAGVISAFLSCFLSPHSSYALFRIFISESDCTPLQCFYKGCIQSNQQLALSLLMHSIHCGSAVFPYQALEIRQAQETVIPDVMVEWLALLLRIREVPGSNLGPETDYPDWGFSWFSSVFPGKCRDSTLNYATTASFHILFNSLFTIILSFDAVQSELLKASLNKP
jgi:hypothetical protein